MHCFLWISKNIRDIQINLEVEVGWLNLILVDANRKMSSCLQHIDTIFQII